MLNGWLPPFFRQLVGKLSRSGLVVEEEDIEDHVYADFDEEYGVIFFPPVYAQRYAAVCDCLMDEQWFGKLEKVLNIGKQHDVNFMKYLTEVPGITQILGLDIECSINCSYDMLDLVLDDNEQRWDKPLQIILLQGDAADPDYRLIGCDAVIAIDLLERLLPNDIDRLMHNIFGFIKPWVVLFTTPNADFNVLMKNLDKNGLRQPDHYFEWTRAQLHDWCSNIVERYPEYKVISRGVGPGPAGTAHYGCYTQLVLFISKCYKKEMELNVNSLVLVSNPPEQDIMSDIGWVTPSDAPSMRSILDRLEEASSTDLHFPDSSKESTPNSSPACSQMSFHQVDKSSQCNLDVEFGRSFVMFNDEDLYQVRTARQRVYKNVYEIGDVASRLNNTMDAVTQFSKTTQYLIEKNLIDPPNTQDMMEEISQLSDKLICNVNRGGTGHMWNNVNWGENVPYWNQYYKVLGVYNYPYEGKSEDDIILDLILEEITKLLDAEGIDGVLAQGKQLEIPIELLMEAVNHITDDVDRVIMLLEDNGYEVEGEAVVHSTIDLTDVVQEDDAECNSEFDMVSSGTTFVLDSDRYVLNRTLNHKVRKLQLLLPNDEDFKQALGQVICRLKKIAMRCGQGKQGPARSRWLMLKLLDLLKMTEKALLRKKLRDIERDPLRGFNFDTADETAVLLSRIKAEDKASIIVEKYKNLLRISAEALSDCGEGYLDELRSDWEDHVLSLNEEMTGIKLNEHNQKDWDENAGPYPKVTKEYQISQTVTPQDSKHRKSRMCKVKSSVTITKKMRTCSSNNIVCKKKSKHNDKQCPGCVTVKNILKKTASCRVHEKEMTGDKHEKVPKKLTFDNNVEDIGTIRNVDEPAFVVSIKSKPIPDSIFELCHPDLIQKSNASVLKEDPQVDKMEPVSTTEDRQMVEILTHDETLTVALQRTVGIDPDDSYELYPRDLEPDVSDLLIMPPAYILASMEDGQSNEIMVYDAQEDTLSSQDLSDCTKRFSPHVLPVAITEKTRIVEILTEEESELVALQRTVGTEPDSDAEECDQKLEHTKLTNSLNDLAPHENVPAWVGQLTSQEFFLYDLNEPTTSKGLRHVGMDVQCGTDATISNYAMMSATTSFTNPFKRFGTGLKIEDSVPDTRATKTDCVTSTHDILKSCGSTSPPWTTCVGIKIKDSCHLIDVPLAKDKKEESVFGPFTIAEDEYKSNSPKNKIVAAHANQKIVRCGRIDNDSDENMYNSGSSAIPVSIGNSKRYRRPTCCSKLNVKDFPRAQQAAGANTQIIKVSNDMRPKLSCGGVHVHSYKDLQVSEDVMFQGEWQRFRPKPLRKALTYYIPKKPSLHSTDKSKFTCKANAPVKQQQRTVSQRPKTAPVTVRNTKCNKKSKENTVKTNSQNKVQVVKPQVNRFRPESMEKVASKLVARFSKPIDPKPKPVIQPDRPARLPRQTKGKEYKPPILYSRNSCPAPSFNKIFKKKSASKIQSKSRNKTDSLSNLLLANDGRKRPTPSQAKVEEVMNALLKVSIGPPESLNYVVYRNETETAKCSATVEKISNRPSDKEDSLRRHLSNLSKDSSTCSSRNSAATVLNPQPVNRTKPLKSRRQLLPKKSSLPCKGSDSKMLSRFKKLVNKMVISKKSPLDITHVPGTSTVTKSSSKNVAPVAIMSPASDVFASCQASRKSSAIYTKCPGSRDGTDTRDKNIERFNTQDSTTVLILKPHKKDSDSQESDTRVTTPKRISSDCTSNIFVAMKRLVEERLEFIDSSDRNRSTETGVEKRNDFDYITCTESETYETARSYDVTSIRSLTQSNTDFSLKSMPFTSKVSDCFADNESWNTSSPLGDCLSNSDNKAQGIIQLKEHISAQMSVVVHGFSAASMKSLEPPGKQEPDYVNLVDSETGSYAVVATRPSTSEEVLVSDRSSPSYVSCVLDEEAVIPTWLFNNDVDHDTGSFNSARREVPELQAAEPEMPDPFAMNYDENGNEIVSHAAGAGDGHGIHSDPSQDSSGQGSTFSSSEESSRVHSESIVIDPSTFVEQFQSEGEHSSTMNAALAVTQESIDAAIIVAIENANAPQSPSRIPRSARRVSLPASDADVSSDDTDVAYDN